ncbi:MAG: hypothetical protein AB7U41_06705 [Dongiaceae bacterium]
MSEQATTNGLEIYRPHLLAREDMGKDLLQPGHAHELAWKAVNSYRLTPQLVRPAQAALKKALGYFIANQPPAYGEFQKLITGYLADYAVMLHKEADRQKGKQVVERSVSEIEGEKHTISELFVKNAQKVIEHNSPQESAVFLRTQLSKLTMEGFPAADSLLQETRKLLGTAAAKLTAAEKSKLGLDVFNLGTPQAVPQRSSRFNGVLSLPRGRGA